MTEPDAALGSADEMTFDAERVRGWAQLTQDGNPLHLDPDFAATTRFGVPITHGHLLACVALDAAQQRNGVRLIEGGRISVRFRAPVPVGAKFRLEHRGVTGGQEEIHGHCRDTDALQMHVELVMVPTKEDADVE